ANALNEVVVRDRKVTGTNAALIQEIREAQSIVSGVSREQIARSQDRDAAEVVRRIPGVSVMQNRFIVVRGLPQRYNAVMLNNAIAPSFEADSRSFSFDILPSNMIDRVMVYKTAVPELPGDFSGGVVKVYTTGMPAKNSFNVTYQASVRPNTTFKSFEQQPQGKLAWLGYDDGTYTMPKDVPGAIGIGDRKAVTPMFNSNWDAVKRTAPVDHRFGLDFSRKMNLSHAVKLGVIGGVNYSNTYQYLVASRNVGIYDTAQKSYQGAYNFSDQVYTNMVRTNGLLNVSLDIAGKNRIDFKNFYTHTGEYEYTDRNGIAGPLAGDGTGLFPGQFIHQTVLTNAFRDIFSSQLNGSHDMFTHTKVNWLLAYTKSNYNDPDQRRRTRLADTMANEQGGVNWSEEAYSNNAVSQIYWGRMYYKLPEETKTLGLDIEHQFVLNSFRPTLKVGLYLERKARNFELRALGLLTDPYDDNGKVINDNDILIGERSSPFNIYSATNDLNAGYAAVSIPFLKRFKFYGGVRVEDNRQQLHSFHWITSGPAAGQVHIDNHVVSP
ncbi:MAG TPA: TonB-dependent receptor plug domain-containing protein, partial [Chitinophagaceae bacterium]|nr:TonB-dependent receptor plug domain-containing protein [Chitinophagaceae bacterium]